MRVTLKDIAKQAGVSYATVSRALNDHCEINFMTKEKIKKIAVEMGYYSNSLKKEQDDLKTIGIIISDITNPFYSKVIRSIEDYVIYKGYNILLANTNWDVDREKDSIELMLRKNVQGLIIMPTSSKTANTVKDLHLNIPVIYVGRKFDDKDTSYVVIDNEKASYTATEYLIQLGHRDIVFIGGCERVMERVNGFKKAMTKYDMNLCNESIINCSLKKENGYVAMLEILKKDKKPTSIIAANDFVALGVMEALDEKNYKVPDDISIVGFDNIEMAGFSKINLTSVDQPKYKMGKIAAEILINNMNKEKGMLFNQIIIETSMILRKSCKKI